MRGAIPLCMLGFGFLSAAAFGQAPSPPDTQPLRPVIRPPELIVAPNALMPTTAGGGAGPVNICRELVAFLEQQQQQQQVQLQQQTAAPSPSATGLQAGQNAPAHQDNAPVPGQTAPNVDKPQHESGMVGPVPPGPPAFKPSPITLEQAREYASRNDILACRDAAQRMRRAGMTMPDSLIALAALRPDLQQTNPGVQ